MKRWFALALLAWAPWASAQWAELTFVDPRLDWRTLETEHFEVHFAARHRAQARAVAGVAERVLPAATGLLRWQPSGRTHIVVLDSADFANGLASPVPFNYAMVFLSPPDEGELLQNREWLELVLTHELFHIAHLDLARDAPLGLRRVFGRVPFFFPHLFQPGWIVEGLAVHAESDPARGDGRLGQAQFEGQMRAEASHGFRPLSELNAGGRGFPLNRDYLYGGYFFVFLKERYGESAISGFIDSYSDNLIPFRVHSNPETVTGKNMDQLWAEYRAWLKSRFSPEIASVQGDVIARAWSLTSPALSADGTRWYIRGDGYALPRVVRQGRGGKPEPLRAVEQDSRLAVSSGGTVLLAEPDICDNYNYYYDLYRVEPDGSASRLSRCARHRLAAPLDGGRAVAVRVQGGETQVVSLGGEVLYRAAPGESISGIAASDAWAVLTSLRDGRWSLIRVAGGRSEVLVSDSAVKHSPRIGDGGEVYFIAGYDSTYNLWSLRGGRLARWTRAAHGVREISAPHAGEILLTTIEPDGDVLRTYRLPDAPLEIRSSSVIQAQSRPVAGVAVPDRPYSPWRSMLPRSWLPLVELADGAVELGVITFGQDALGLHQYAIAPAYELTQGEALGSLTYVYDGRHLLLLDRGMTVNDVDGSDIRAYTIDEGAQWVSTWRHMTLGLRSFWGLGGALERETLHRVDAAALRGQDERVLGLVAGVDTRRTSWLSEGPNEGTQVRLFAETSHGLHGAYDGDVYRIDARVHLPLGRTVLSLRWNEGWGEPDAEPFQLGGSDSDLATLLPILNQREFALRGYTSGEPTLVGSRMRQTSVEWRVPLRDVDWHAMVPPVGLNRVALSVFLDAGDAWFRRGKPDYHYGYGVELMSEVRLGYLYGSHLRLGIAEGRDQGGKTTAYLRLGRAF
ncbi:MAG TPA: hypothetical protein VJQ58_02415 [Burkholderiales bacterium]|nr:hypothetical protein [Burkholderiales bacterium]